MKQQALPLLLKNKEVHLRKYIQDKFNKPIMLILTDNSTSMISVREQQNSISLRLHRIFLNADRAVLDEVIRFIVKKGGNTPAIKELIEKNKTYLKNRPRRKVTINPNGKTYNLVSIFDSLNSEYFNNKVSALITWGKRSPKYTVRKRTLGSYQKKTNIIRINPILDRRRVPRYVVEYVVYHEMLHAVIDAVVKNGRRSIHAKEFRNREREYRNYHKAIEWEKKTFRA
jgi:predicted metal-dependent hydrolase